MSRRSTVNLRRPLFKQRPGHLEGARVSRRQVERDRARARILTAAMQLFARDGRENVNFSDIARRARLSRPLVYFYFADLRSLFLEAAYLAGQRLHARLITAVSGPRSGLEAVLAMGRAYLAFHREEPEQFQVCLAATAAHLAGPPATPLEERSAGQQHAIMDLVEGAVKRGVRDGSIRRDVGDSLTVSLSLWAFVSGLVQLSTNQRDTIERLHGVELPRFLDGGFGLLRAALVGGR